MIPKWCHWPLLLGLAIWTHWLGGMNEQAIHDGLILLTVYWWKHTYTNLTCRIPTYKMEESSATLPYGRHMKMDCTKNKRKRKVKEESKSIKEENEELKVNNAPVNEQIGHWNLIKKWHKRVDYVTVKQQSILLWVTILSVQCAVIGGIFCYRSLLAILRRKIGEPRKKIRNLNGFEYRYLSDLKVPYF